MLAVEGAYCVASNWALQFIIKWRFIRIDKKKNKFENVTFLT